METKTMKYSVVVPLFNEQDSIEALYVSLHQVMCDLGEEFEIIFVNDGSTDNSLRVIEGIKHKDKRVISISFDKNYGKAAAWDAGLRSAKGEYVLTIDVDLQIDPKEFLRLLRELENYDVVIGRRTNRREVDGFVKFVSSRIGNYVRNLILGEDFQDVGCSCCGYRKKCLEGLTLYNTVTYQFFIISLLHMAGYRIKEIDIKTFPRRHGRSNYNIRNRLFAGLIDLLIVKWIQKKRMNYKVTDG